MGKMYHHPAHLVLAAVLGPRGYDAHGPQCRGQALPSNTAVQRLACVAVRYLAAGSSERNERWIEAGVLDHLFEAMSQHASNAAVQEQALTGLTSHFALRLRCGIQLFVTAFTGKELTSHLALRLRSRVQHFAKAFTGNKRTSHLELHRTSGMLLLVVALAGIGRTSHLVLHPEVACGSSWRHSQVTSTSHLARHLRSGMQRFAEALTGNRLTLPLVPRLKSDMQRFVEALIGNKRTLYLMLRLRWGCSLL